MACLVLAVCLLSPVVALLDHQLELLCESQPTKHVVTHPEDCSAYVECYNGPPMVRTCGQGLHYNEHKGVCDYPEAAGCSHGSIFEDNDRDYLGPPAHNRLGPPPNTQGPPPPPSFNRGRQRHDPLPSGPPPPGLTQPRRKFREHRRNQVSHRSTYEETVYGEISRSSTHGNLLRNYGSVLMQEAKEYVRERMKGELHLYNEMYDVIDSGPYRLVSRFLNARPYVKSLSQPAMANIHIMKLMKQRFDTDVDLLEMMRSQGLVDLLRELPGVYEPETQMPIPPDIDYCPYPSRMSCRGKALTFRMADGACNNLNKPLWGRSLTPFRRLVAHRYDDGIEEMRRSVSGRPLPGARHVSSRLFPDADIPQQDRNMMMVFWGQLIDHDLTLTAITEVPVDESFDDTTELKCGFDGCATNGPGLEACWPIPVPHDDSDFPYNRCLKFVRSAEVPPLSCETGPREQLDQATHWIDASMIYGVTKEDNDNLRDISNRARGKMTVRKHPDDHQASFKHVLPAAEDDVCRDVNRTHNCYLAGDERVNENAGLTVYHTALIREHNRIEDALHEINPQWDGERLYQECRRIITAMVQHILFNEWLPLILGNRVLKELDLELKSSGYYHGYNPAPDPRIPNAFSAAAFRFGHTLLEEKIRRMDEEYKIDDDLFLSQTFFRPTHSYSLEHGGLDSLARGLANLPCQSYDQFVTKQVTRHLFTERPPFGPSMDLLSLNIQRGRDHGIGTYNDFREKCGLRRAVSFDDLRGEIHDDRAINALRKTYDDVDDIDLFAGGISEKSLPDGQVGPTFACIIGRTFQALRQGDRFWYENDNDAGFTPGQLQEIRKTMISRILCANMDNMPEIQKWLFMMPTKDGRNSHDNDFSRFSERIATMKVNNPRMPCDSLPEPDLTLWKTRKHDY